MGWGVGLVSHKAISIPHLSHSGKDSHGIVMKPDLVDNEDHFPIALFLVAVINGGLEHQLPLICPLLNLHNQNKQPTMRNCSQEMRSGTR